MKLKFGIGNEKCRRKAFTIARKLFKRRTCKITTSILTAVLLIVSTAFFLIFRRHEYYSHHIVRLEREDKIFEYRKSQEPTLYALCSYMGFTELNMDSCNHHCDMKADMWRKRQLMDFEGNEKLAFMEDCPPILDIVGFWEV
uniref:BRICHOS domain-containing protein n=1 Tax=Bursaphelenchus xylophilus TaxID=6326 RepID=A0A1I7SJE8_BURXY